MGNKRPPINFEEHGESAHEIAAKYKIIYADPPWKYSSDVKAKRGIWGTAQKHYPSMITEQLKELPVNEMADKDSVCFRWATYPILPECIEVLESWGFVYKTIAFVWDKQNKAGTDTRKYGLGWYTRSNCEVVLIGRKGEFDRKSAKVQQVIFSPIREYSRKPDEIRERILELCGDLPRIELFARTHAEGWDVWGNETGKFKATRGKLSFRMHGPRHCLERKAVT
jgi:N6-adenosine-specific RNA methylase IME4